MNIFFFSNPTFFGNQAVPEFTSMPRFTKMLVDGMNERGHQVKILVPKSLLFRIPFKPLKKLLGYLDQYILFPFFILTTARTCDTNTLFVFTDQAQGPWIPLIVRYPHIVHCHDFLSQYSALGKIPENITGLSGKIYQFFIRQGLLKSKHFISDSFKTQKDLLNLLKAPPVTSEVVYVGLSESYTKIDFNAARALLGNKLNINLAQGYILHVGGNVWYKNRLGVIEIYNFWRSMDTQLHKLPLILIGEQLTDQVLSFLSHSPFRSDIYVLTGLEDKVVRLAYSGATLFLFPSLAEGFGWPIAEAMACGCPVITTNETPMTEVAGESAFFISRRPINENQIKVWTKEASEMINQVLNLSSIQREEVINAGLVNIKRFDRRNYIKKVEEVYEKVLNF